MYVLYPTPTPKDFLEKTRAPIKLLVGAYISTRHRGMQRIIGQY